MHAWQQLATTTMHRRQYPRTDICNPVCNIMKQYCAISKIDWVVVGSHSDCLLSQAQIEHEVLVRMKEKLRGEHDYESRVEEQKFLDEIAGSRSVKDPQ